MNYTNRFRVKPGSKVDLGKVDAGFKDKHESHEQALPQIEAYNQNMPPGLLFPRTTNGSATSPSPGSSARLWSL